MERKTIKMEIKLLVDIDKKIIISQKENSRNNTQSPTTRKKNIKKGDKIFLCSTHLTPFFSFLLSLSILYLSLLLIFFTLSLYFYLLTFGYINIFFFLPIACPCKWILLFKTQVCIYVAPFFGCFACKRFLFFLFNFKSEDVRIYIT